MSMTTPSHRFRNGLMSRTAASEFPPRGCPQTKQIYDHPNNERETISHPATASRDSPSTASQIGFCDWDRGISGTQTSSQPFGSSSCLNGTALFQLANSDTSNLLQD